MESYTNHTGTVSRCINDAPSHAGGYMKYIFTGTYLRAKKEILRYLYETYLKGVAGKRRRCFTLKVP